MVIRRSVKLARHAMSEGASRRRFDEVVVSWRTRLEQLLSQAVRASSAEPGVRERRSGPSPVPAVVVVEDEVWGRPRRIRS